MQQVKMKQYHLLTSLIATVSVFISVANGDGIENGNEDYVNANCQIEKLHMRIELKKETLHSINGIQDDVVDKEKLVWTIKEQYQLVCSPKKLNETEDKISVNINIRFVLNFSFYLFYFSSG